MYMSLEGDLSINDAARFINGKANMMTDRIEGFKVVISDSNNRFKDFVISKKRLVESPFLGEPKLSPSFGSNIQSSKSDVNTSTYGKNVDFMRSTASTLVPYTTEQPVGRIKVGSPVDSADIRTLLATDTSMTAYQCSVLEKGINEVSHHTASIQKDRETRGRPLYTSILSWYSISQRRFCFQVFV